MFTGAGAVVTGTGAVVTVQGSGYGTGQWYRDSGTGTVVQGRVLGQWYRDGY